MTEFVLRHYAAEPVKFDRTEHTVTLAAEARILTLESAEAIHKFDITYGENAFPESSFPGRYRLPNWAQISTEFDGIIVAPYQWSARYDLLWYSSWDVASGCIWNLEAIASVTPLVALA